MRRVYNAGVCPPDTSTCCQTPSMPAGMTDLPGWPARYTMCRTYLGKPLETAGRKVTGTKAYLRYVSLTANYLNLNQ